VANIIVEFKRQCLCYIISASAQISNNKISIQVSLTNVLSAVNSGIPKWIAVAAITASGSFNPIHCALSFDISAHPYFF